MNRIVIPADVMQQVIDCDHGSRTILEVKVEWSETPIELVFER